MVILKRDMIYKSSQLQKVVGFYFCTVIIAIFVTIVKIDDNEYYILWIS